EVRRHLDAARPKADRDSARSIALTEALLASREGKLEDAKKALSAIEGDDSRVKIQLALIALAQNRAQDAKPVVDQLLAEKADHDVARALSQKLDTQVAKSGPLPPEDGHGSGSRGPGPTAPGPGPSTSSPSADYDSLVAKAGKLAEANGCARA